MELIDLAARWSHVLAGVVALCTLGGTQAAITGTVLVRDTAGVRAVHGLAGGDALAEYSSPRPGSPLLGQRATAFSALPVLLICGGLLLSQPAVRPDTTDELSASSVQLIDLEGGRVGLALPGSAATLYVHEDYLLHFWQRALAGAPPAQPISLRVYQHDLERLDQPVRVRALEIRSAEQVYLPLEPVAAGRNAAEPLLPICTIGALLVILRAASTTLRRLLQRHH